MFVSLTKIAIFVCLLAMLGLFFAWYAARQWLKTRLKNRVLAQQIREAILYKDKYEELKVLTASPNPSKGENAEMYSDIHHTGPSGNLPSPLTEKIGETRESLDTLTPEELFHYIEHEVKRQMLFLNPSFDRQSIMDEFHLSKERVGAAFSQGSQYDSLPQFISDLRLEYASRLLVTTDLSIIDISAKAGFSNPSVFSRYFSRKFQISPTQYRRTNSEDDL